MTSETPRCEFRADMIVSTPAGGHRRLLNVQCIQDEHHADLGYGDAAEHEFFAADTHTFGASREGHRWVTRR
ncbi:hypothetical protein [Microbacterium sp. BDGP8]|uniref:hypothetical protein n=1 Tax=Microbacterium sp. BDGP8 TaxID=3035531 RepID=UPI00249E687F|nr:hypothetical protein [Microbacterium sp. BDGP8]WHE37794.1 hypothetical protein P6897_16080 [Microbacterium sp. BDGP8]